MNPFSPEIEAYLGTQTAESYTRLTEILRLAQSEFPNCNFKISYGVIQIHIEGTYICYVGGYAKHIGMYPIPRTEDWLQKFAGLKSGKGSVQFSHTQTLPIPLITELLHNRYLDYEDRLTQKQLKSHTKKI